MVAARFAIAGLLLLGAAMAINRVVYESSGARQRDLIETTTAREIEKLRGGETRASITYAETLEAIAAIPALRDSVTKIAFWTIDMSDPRAECVSDFSSVKSLFFYSCTDTAAIAGCLADLPKLQSVAFETTPVDTSLLNALIATPTLETLRFEQIMADEVIADLKKRRSDLEIEWAKR